MERLLHVVQAVDRLDDDEGRGGPAGEDWDVVQVIEVLSTPVPFHFAIVLGLSLASIIISAVTIWMNRR